MRKSGADKGSPSCPVEYCVALCVRRTGAFTADILLCSLVSSRYNGGFVCTEQSREWKAGGYSSLRERLIRFSLGPLPGTTGWSNRALLRSSIMRSALRHARAAAYRGFLLESVPQASRQALPHPPGTLAHADPGAAASCCTGVCQRARIQASKPACPRGSLLLPGSPDPHHRALRSMSTITLP